MIRWILMAVIAVGLWGAVTERCHAEITPAVVGVHVGSKHMDSGSGADGSLGWNNSNPGVYARWGNGFTVGHYENSLRRPSTYAGWTFDMLDGYVGLTVGVATGYDKLVDGPGDHRAVRCAEKCRWVNLKNVITPLLVPSVRLPVTEKVGVRLSALLPPGQPMAFHLSIEGHF